jgi:hypothetical protein
LQLSQRRFNRQSTTCGIELDDAEREKHHDAVESVGAGGFYLALVA